MKGKVNLVFDFVVVNLNIQIVLNFFAHRASNREDFICHRNIHLSASLFQREKKVKK